jgi:acetoin:2,6-dichlorophenolindophenol oxidoreductase subunit alpha
MIFDEPTLKKIYYYMVLSREYENCANDLYESKQIDEKPLSGIGQEAVSVGATFPLEASDYVLPSLRTKGAFLAKGIPVTDCFLQLFRKKDSPSRGLWTSHHMGDMNHGVLLSSALVASSLSVAVGVALSAKLRKSGQVLVAYFGDGASSRADFHESINLASVQDLPMVFVCENNLYALSTGINDQMKNPNIADRAIGYGIPGKTVDGQDVLAVIDAVKEAVDRARAGQGPTLLDCKTYRYRGHTETHDPVDGRPQEEYAAWSERCPIAVFEAYLKNTAIAQAELDEIKASVTREIEEAVQAARNSPDAEITDFEALVYA